MLSDGIKNEGNPLLLTQFILQIPTILVIPSVEELNSHVQLVVKNLIQVHDCIIMWGQRYSRVKGSKDSDGNCFVYAVHWNEIARWKLSVKIEFFLFNR